VPYAGAPLTVSTEVRTAPVPPATVGTLVDPTTVLLRVKKPDQTFLPDYTSPVHDGLGKYHVDVPGADLVAAGHYQYAWITTGAGAGGVPGEFDLDDLFAPQMLSLQDAKAYLGETAGTSQDEEIRAFTQVATEVVESIVGPCVPRTVTEQVPAVGGSVLQLLRRPVILVTSVTSVYGATPTWATVDLQVDQAAGIVRLVNGGEFSGGPFTAVYVAGRAVIPDRFTHAAKAMLRELWKSQRAQTVDSPMPDFGDEIGGGLQPFIPNVVIPPEVYQLLAADRPAGVA
jgi:hypothetical protein